MKSSEKEILYRIYLIEKAFLFSTYVVLNKSFNDHVMLKDLEICHYSLRNIIIVLDEKKEIIKGFIRYKVIDTKTLLITSICINSKSFPAGILRQLFHKTYQEFYLLEQEEVISEVYKLNKMSLNFQVKLGFKVYSESEDKNMLIISKDQLLNKLKTFL